MKKNIVIELYQKPQTVFTLNEINLLFPHFSYKALINKLAYAVHTGKLAKPRRGIYVKSDYNAYELGNKIFTPSYISFETVLQQEGIVFQQYQTVFLASYLTRKITVDGHEFYYRKVKSEVLVNKTGIKEEDNYFIAGRERAFLDAVFLYKNYHFDNLREINWKLVEQTAPIYQSRILLNRVKEYKRISRENV